MPVQTLFINGPAGGGKTTVAHVVATQVMDRPVHYLRTRQAASDRIEVVSPPASQPAPADLTPPVWASHHLVDYSPDRVFETLPDALRKVRRIERKAFIVIEADADPALRHAFPYDYRMFVMGCPRHINDVFRTPKAAAVALQQVMQDTAAFAAEIFGLFESDLMDDTVELSTKYLSGAGGGRIEHLELSETQIIRFLKSPLGGEIASRIQLQPDYHAMVESDVVLINTGVGEEGEALCACVQRIEKLLARIRHDTRRHSVLYWGDVFNRQDPTNIKLLRRLKTLFVP